MENTLTIIIENCNFNIQDLLNFKKVSKEINKITSAKISNLNYQKLDKKVYDDIFILNGEEYKLCSFCNINVCKNQIKKINRPHTIYKIICENCIIKKYITRATLIKKQIIDKNYNEFIKIPYITCWNIIIKNEKSYNILYLKDNIIIFLQKLQNNNF